MITTNDLEKQIEAAFDYRGYVTIKLNNGDVVEGFVFNRQFSNPLLKEEPFIEVFLKSNGEKKQFLISAIQSLALTGEDCAATAAGHPSV